MANNRYQLKVDVHMPLDGQPGIVLSGTVFDDVSTNLWLPTIATLLSPGEPAGSLGSHGKATAVRTVRRA